MSVVKAGLTSGVIMLAGDLCAQTFEMVTAPAAGAKCEKAKKKDGGYDPLRTLRFAILGATCHGPFFNFGFAWVDRLFGSPLAANGAVLWAVLAKKVLTTQFILNPPYMLILFSWLGILEGRTNPADILKNTLVRLSVGMHQP